jgi:hypothetical protein
VDRSTYSAAAYIHRFMTLNCIATSCNGSLISRHNVGTSLMSTTGQTERSLPSGLRIEPQGRLLFVCLWKMLLELQTRILRVKTDFAQTQVWNFTRGPMICQNENIVPNYVFLANLQTACMFLITFYLLQS